MQALDLYVCWMNLVKVLLQKVSLSTIMIVHILDASAICLRENERKNRKKEKEMKGKNDLKIINYFATLLQTQCL